MDPLWYRQDFIYFLNQLRSRSKSTIKRLFKFSYLEYTNAVARDLPVLGRLQVYLYDNGSIFLPLLARRRVLPGDAAGLVEHVRLHSSCVCTYKYLEINANIIKILFIL